ncbi:hypothetical protein J4E93_000043 [Alternaria ventricosa]|uniref:uncharacterized protein n=1 Tax=Alternaria ventricosa TaxID=1187951 RepID=UPI0020C43743|nr:uncharacterized protein J4E93_000043 [Alternaria ventricosa]KAI4655331.1 hypothetical protein J4E93_000043 [Alternaria ventricosa]
MGGKNKKKSAAGADGMASSSKKKKGRGGMSDKQEENKTRTLEDLNSSSAWDRDDAEDDATREPDDVAETSEEPIESTPTTEQAQDVTETEPVKSDDPQDELPQQEPDVAETEIPWTTTPSTRKNKASNVSDAEDVSSDALPSIQVPTDSWSFGEKGVTDDAKSQDAGQLQDTTNFHEDVGDKLKHLSLETQTLQEDVKVTDGKEKQDTIVAADNAVRRPKVEDEAALGNSSDESSAPLEAHRALSPSPLKEQLGETREPTEDQGNKVRASTELPQKPKLNDRPAPPTQEMVKQPATARPLADKPQLPSKPQSSTEVQQTQAPPPAQLQQPPKSKPPIQAQTQLPVQSQRPSKSKTSVQVQGTQTEHWTPPLPPVTPKNPTRDQGTNTEPWTPQRPPFKPKTPTRDQGTQTEPWFEPQPPAKHETITRNQGAQAQVPSSSAPKPKSHGRAEPPLRGILKKSTASPSASTRPQNQEIEISNGPRAPRPSNSATPSASTGPQNQGSGFPYGRPAPPSNGLAQSSQNRRSLEPERNNHGTAGSTYGSASGTPLGRFNVPATPPVRSTPDQRRSPRPILIQADPDLVVELVVNHQYDRSAIAYQRTLARNTDHFIKPGNLYPASGKVRSHFVGEQFSSRVVKEYVEWLDRGRLPTMASLGRLTPSRADEVLMFLARAYIFGERIDDRAWMNDVMNSFTYVHIHDWRLELDDVILFTYKFSVSDSRLRTLLADLFAYLLPDPEQLLSQDAIPLVEELRVLPAAFIRAVRREMMQRINCTPSCWRARLDHPSHYYVDEEGEGGLSWRQALDCGHSEATLMR